MCGEFWLLAPPAQMDVHTPDVLLLLTSLSAAETASVSLPIDPSDLRLGARPELRAMPGRCHGAQA